MYYYNPYPYEEEDPSSVNSPNGLRDAINKAYAQPVVPASRGNFLDSYDAAMRNFEASQWRDRELAALEEGDQAKAEYMRSQAENAEMRAGLYQQSPEFTDVLESPSKFGDWLAGAGGQSAASMHHILAGTGAGAAVGGVAGGLLGSVVPGVGTVAGVLLGAKAGASLGGIASGYNLEANETISEALRDEELRKQGDWDAIRNTSRVKGAVAGALEFAPFAGAAYRMTRPLTNALGKGFVRNVAGEMLPVMAGEGLTEAAQSLVGQAAMKNLRGQDMLTTDYDWSQALNEGMAGVVGGGMMGSVPAVGRAGLAAYRDAGGNEAMRERVGSLLGGQQEAEQQAAPVGEQSATTEEAPPVGEPDFRTNAAGETEDLRATQAEPEAAAQSEQPVSEPVAETANEAAAAAVADEGMAAAEPQSTTAEPQTRRVDDFWLDENGKPVTLHGVPITKQQGIKRSLGKHFKSVETANDNIVIASTVEEAMEAAPETNAVSIMQQQIAANPANRANFKAFTATMPDGKQRVVLIGENIKQGEELGAFLHEVGVHVGMRQAFKAKNLDINVLADKIKQIASAKVVSPEVQVARRALAQAEKTGNPEEYVAYFVQYALEAKNKKGERIFTPTALKKPSAQLLAQIIDALKSFLASVGLKTTKVDTQQLIDFTWALAKQVDGDVNLGDTARNTFTEPVEKAEDVAPVSVINDIEALTETNDIVLEGAGLVDDILDENPTLSDEALDDKIQEKIKTLTDKILKHPALNGDIKAAALTLKNESNNYDAFVETMRQMAFTHAPAVDVVRKLAMSGGLDASFSLTEEAFEMFEETAADEASTFIALFNKFGGNLSQVNRLFKNGLPESLKFLSEVQTVQTETDEETVGKKPRAFIDEERDGAMVRALFLAILSNKSGYTDNAFTLIEQAAHQVFGRNTNKVFRALEYYVANKKDVFNDDSYVSLLKSIQKNKKKNDNTIKRLITRPLLHYFNDKARAKYDELNAAVETAKENGGDVDRARSRLSNFLQGAMSAFLAYYREQTRDTLEERNSKKGMYQHRWYRISLSDKDNVEKKEVITQLGKIAKTLGVGNYVNESNFENYYNTLDFRRLLGLLISDPAFKNGGKFENVKVSETLPERRSRISLDDYGTGLFIDFNGNVKEFPATNLIPEANDPVFFKIRRHRDGEIILSEDELKAARARVGEIKKIVSERFKDIIRPRAIKGSVVVQRETRKLRKDVPFNKLSKNKQAALQKELYDIYEKYLGVRRAEHTPAEKDFIKMFNANALPYAFDNPTEADAFVQFLGTNEPVSVVKTVLGNIRDMSPITAAAIEDNAFRAVVALQQNLENVVKRETGLSFEISPIKSQLTEDENVEEELSEADILGLAPEQTLVDDYLDDVNPMDLVEEDRAGLKEGTVLRAQQHRVRFSILATNEQLHDFAKDKGVLIRDADGTLRAPLTSFIAEGFSPSLRNQLEDKQYWLNVNGRLEYVGPGKGDVTFNNSAGYKFNKSAITDVKETERVLQEDFGYFTRRVDLFTASILNEAKRMGEQRFNSVLLDTDAMRKALASYTPEWAQEKFQIIQNEYIGELNRALGVELEESNFLLPPSNTEYAQKLAKKLEYLSKFPALKERYEYVKGLAERFSLLSDLFNTAFVKEERYPDKYFRNWAVRDGQEALKAALTLAGYMSQDTDYYAIFVNFSDFQTNMEMNWRNFKKQDFATSATIENLVEGRLSNEYIISEGISKNILNNPDFTVEMYKQALEKARKGEIDINTAKSAVEKQSVIINDKVVRNTDLLARIDDEAPSTIIFEGNVRPNKDQFGLGRSGYKLNENTGRFELTSFEGIGDIGYSIPSLVRSFMRSYKDFYGERFIEAFSGSDRSLLSLFLNSVASFVDLKAPRDHELTNKVFFRTLGSNRQDLTGRFGQLITPKYAFKHGVPPEYADRYFVLYATNGNENAPLLKAGHYALETVHPKTGIKMAAPIGVHFTNARKREGGGIEEFDDLILFENIDNYEVGSEQHFILTAAQALVFASDDEILNLGFQKADGLFSSLNAFFPKHMQLFKETEFKKGLTFLEAVATREQNLKDNEYLINEFDSNGDDLQVDYMPMDQALTTLVNAVEENENSDEVFINLEIAPPPVEKLAEQLTRNEYKKHKNDAYKEGYDAWRERTLGEMTKVAHNIHREFKEKLDGEGDTLTKMKAINDMYINNGFDIQKDFNDPLTGTQDSILANPLYLLENLLSKPFADISKRNEENGVAENKDMQLLPALLESATIKNDLIVKEGNTYRFQFSLNKEYLKNLIGFAQNFVGDPKDEVSYFGETASSVPVFLLGASDDTFTKRIGDKDVRVIDSIKLNDKNREKNRYSILITTGKTEFTGLVALEKDGETTITDEYFYSLTSFLKEAGIIYEENDILASDIYIHDQSISIFLPQKCNDLIELTYDEVLKRVRRIRDYIKDTSLLKYPEYAAARDNYENRFINNTLKGIKPNASLKEVAEKLGFAKNGKIIPDAEGLQISQLIEKYKGDKLAAWDKAYFKRNGSTVFKYELRNTLTELAAGIRMADARGTAIGKNMQIPKLSREEYIKGDKLERDPQNGNLVEAHKNWDQPFVSWDGFSAETDLEAQWQDIFDSTLDSGVTNDHLLKKVNLTEADTSEIIADIDYPEMIKYSAWDYRPDARDAAKRRGKTRLWLKAFKKDILDTGKLRDEKITLSIANPQNIPPRRLLVSPDKERSKGLRLLDFFANSQLFDAMVKDGRIVKKEHGFVDVTITKQNFNDIVNWLGKEGVDENGELARAISNGLLKGMSHDPNKQNILNQLRAFEQFDADIRADANNVFFDEAKRAKYLRQKTNKIVERIEIKPDSSVEGRNTLENLLSDAATMPNDFVVKDDYFGFEDSGEHSYNSVKAAYNALKSGVFDQSAFDTGVAENKNSLEGKDMIEFRINLIMQKVLQNADLRQMLVDNNFLFDREIKGKDSLFDKRGVPESKTTENDVFFTNVLRTALERLRQMYLAQGNDFVEAGRYAEIERSESKFGGALDKITNLGNEGKTTLKLGKAGYSPGYVYNKILDFLHFIAIAERKPNEAPDNLTAMKKGNFPTFAGNIASNATGAGPWFVDIPNALLKNFQAAYNKIVSDGVDNLQAFGKTKEDLFNTLFEITDAIQNDEKFSQVVLEREGTSKESADRAVEYLESVFGDRGEDFDIAWENGAWGEKASRVGSYTKKENKHLIKLALAGNILSTAHHEAYHGLLSVVKKHNPQHYNKLLQLSEKYRPYVEKILEEKEANAALNAIQNDPEELASYAYQFWMAGLIPHNALSKRVVGKFGRLWMSIVGLVNDAVRRKVSESGGLLEAETKLHALYKRFNEGGLAHSKDAFYRQLDADLAPKRRWERWNKAASAFGKFFDNILAASDTVLRRSDIPELEEIADMFYVDVGEHDMSSMHSKGEKGGALSRYRQLHRIWTNRYHNLTKEYAKEEKAAIRKALLNKDRNMLKDERLRKGYDAYREFFDGVFNEFNEMGVERKEYSVDTGKNEWKPFEYAKDFIPFLWSRDAIRNNRKEFTELLFEEVEKAENENRIYVDAARRGDRIKACREYAENIVSEILGENRDDHADSAFWVDKGTFKQNAERYLDFVEDRAKFDKFLSGDIDDMVFQYSMRTSKNAVFQQVFGKDLEKLNALLAKARESVAKKYNLSGKELDERMAHYEHAIHSMMGMLGQDMSPQLRTINSYGAMYQNVRLLAMVLFSSIQDIAGLRMHGGTLKDQWDGLVRGLKSGVKVALNKDDRDKWMQRAEEFGIVPALSNPSIIQELAGTQDIEGKAGAFNRGFFRYILMEGWTRGTRAQAAIIAERKILEWKEKGVDRANKGDVLTFERCFGNMDPKDIKTDGVYLENNEANRIALGRLVDDMVMNPTEANKPLWANDPRFILFAQLKTFSYTIHRVLLRGIIEQIRQGNIAPAVSSFAGLIPTALAGYLVKEAILSAVTGDDDDDWKWKWDSMMPYVINRSGVFGIPQMFWEDKSDPANLFGPTIGQIQDIASIPIRGQFGTNWSHTPEREALSAMPAGTVLKRFYDAA